MQTYNVLAATLIPSAPLHAPPKFRLYREIESICIHCHGPRTKDSVPLLHGQPHSCTSKVNNTPTCMLYTQHLDHVSLLSLPAHSNSLIHTKQPKPTPLCTMKSETKRFFLVCAITVAIWKATSLTLNQDHIRISEDRRRLGIRFRPPNEPTDADGRLKWRAEHYRPAPGVSRVLNSRGAVEWKLEEGQEQPQGQEQRRRGEDR